MKFGVSGELIPSSVAGIDDALCARVRALGFSGIFTRFRDSDPFATSRADCRRARDVLAANGLMMYQATGYWQCLVHPDEGQRAQAVRTLQAALRMAGDLGARAIDTGPGSLSPRGPWCPHPDNWLPRSQEQLVRSLRDCAKAAEDSQVILSLEGHQLVTLSSARVMRDVLTAVDSPWVRCDFDPVNWITLETVFDTGPAISAMMDTLGDQIVSAHAKDIIIEDRLTLHLTERPAGQGTLNYDVLLSRIEALDPSYPVIVEGAGVADLPAVSDFLHSTANRLGIKVLD